MKAVKESENKTVEDHVNSNPKIPAWAKDIAIKNGKARQAFHEKKVKELA